MAEAKLNFVEENLDKTSDLYDLYTRFYQGMHEANLVDAPDYTTNPPLTEDGAIDEAKIKEGLDSYTTILLKNSAYMMANAIISCISGGGGGGENSGFVSRAGDTMTGLLGALYGFEAGYSNNKIFDVSINADEENVAHIYGFLTVDKDVTIDGQLNLSNDGIYFGAQQAMYIGNNKLNIAYQDILMTGDVEIDDSLKIGDVSITTDGITWGDYEFYHSGNCNDKNTDWSMKDGHVYGNLTVDGTSTLNGALTAHQGFSLGEFGNALLYSVQKDIDNKVAAIELASDLSLKAGYAIKFGDVYLIKVRNDEEKIVSFAAPGMTMNLGDSDGETPTTLIALQADIYNYNSTKKMVSKNGDGYFPNSFMAGCANSGDTVMQTYYTASDNCGVIFGHNIRFGVAAGPALSANSTNTGLVGTIPYVHTVNELPKTEQINFTLANVETTSLFKDQSKEWSATLKLTTDSEFFSIGNPVEVQSISIASETYKTRLYENVLMFADAVYIEGVTDGMRFQGNAYYTGSLSSSRFASGFAGYGWAIIKDDLYGNYAATFDELTVRKKMRVYELEVQKLSATNGSLWVSDSCSGDIVTEIS